VIAGHLPSAILILPKLVSRSPPKTSSMYPSSISRALCSAGMRCIKPLAPSRNETNSSRVNGGADKTWAIPRICAYAWRVQASHPATIKLIHYLDGLVAVRSPCTLSAAGHIIVQRIALLGRQPARDLISVYLGRLQPDQVDILRGNFASGSTAMWQSPMPKGKSGR
jgi:hypothetical protein